MRSSSTQRPGAELVRRRWRPGPVQRAALTGGVVGSAGGLAFGLLVLNRPLLNALAFYLLGFALGWLVGALVGLTARRRRTRG